MKRIKLLGLTALLSITTFVNSGCPNCSDALGLCDLAIQAFTVPENVTVGQTFNAVTDVLNDEEGGECTTTDIASATLNLIEVFQKDGAGNWNSIFENSGIDQQSISAGSIARLLQSLTINQAGDFRLDYYDDSMDNVEERNEGNNYGNIGRSDSKSAIQKTNNYATVYITVHPLPDGTTEIKGKPIVEFH